MNSYSAIAIRNTVPASREPGLVIIDTHSVHFKGGDWSYTFTAEELQVTLGGANDHLIFFRSIRQPEIHFYTDDSRVLEHGLFANYPSLVKTNRQSSSPYAKAFGLFLMVALVIIGLFVGLFFMFKDPLIEAAAHKVPFTWEQKLGEQMFSVVTAGHTLVDNDSLKKEFVTALRPLLDEATTQGFTPELYFAINPEINAFALPGGKVVINSGLIEHAHDWEEVGGVLAHELAHVIRRHHVRSTLNELGLSVVFSALLGDLGALTQTGSSLAGLSNSRKFETEADETGWNLLTQANMDPSGMIRFFEILKKEYGTEMSKNITFLSTHPDVDARIQNLQEKLATHNGSFQKLADTFTAFQFKIQELIK